MKLDDAYFGELANQYMQGIRGGSRAEEQRHLYLLFKEVSEDTKHACAEVRADESIARNDCDPAVEAETLVVFLDGFKLGQEAHARACMNVGGGKP